MRQKTRYSALLRPLLIVGDFFMLNVTFVSLFLFLVDHIQDTVQVQFWVLLLLLNLTFIPARWLLDIALHRRILFADEIVQRTFYFILIHLVLFLATLSLFKVEDVSRYFMMIFFVALFFTVCAWRLIYRVLLKRYRKMGFNYTNVVILGMGQNALSLYQEMTGDKSYGYIVLGFFDDRAPQPVTQHTYLGTLEEALQYIEENTVDEVFCAYTDSKRRIIRDIITYCENNCVRFFMVPKMREYVPKQYKLSSLGAIPVLSLHKEPLQLVRNRFVKRTFDIVFSLSVLLLFFPFVFIIIGLLIKISSPGPIFFSQLRNGEMGKIFTCWKFRSMVVNKDCNTKQTVSNDPRKTWIGNIIRRTSIDEMPQFYNVLKGDMSIVGPRPHMLEHTRVYSELVDRYMLRHLVKPGITGWAQINGYRGEIRDVAFMQKRVESDVWYIEHWSFFLDLKIVYKTVLGAVIGDKHAI